MADMMRMSGSGALGGFQRDKLGSPSTGSEDGGGIDLGDIAQELDQDEFDGPVAFNGRVLVVISYFKTRLYGNYFSLFLQVIGQQLLLPRKASGTMAVWTDSVLSSV